MKTTPKRVYVNGDLWPLLLSSVLPEREWIFSQGRRWLRLSPGRLWRLVVLFGKSDERVQRLIDAIHRHEAYPENYLLPLGIITFPFGVRPYAVCPACDNLHQPHPLDAEKPCQICAAEPIPTVTAAMAADRILDRQARDRLMAIDPELFYEGVLWPNRKYNRHRLVERNWEAAASRIQMGATYKEVAREFTCSVGLLHKKVREVIQKQEV